jgi:transcriptional regulator with PAS, ATPase and Fis domain
VLATTNQEIEYCVSAEFRPDPFFRLNVGRIRLPPVRERHEDLPDILAHYLQQLN